MKKETTDKQEFNITVYTENHIALLTQITSIFTRRKLNIERMNTSPSETADIYHFHIVISEKRDVIIKLLQQLKKLSGVIKADHHSI